MNKYISLLLFLVLLLTACAAQPVPRGVVVRPGQPQPPAATQAVKVATMLPAVEQTVQVVLTPTSRALDQQAQETAIANLRALAGDPTLELTFKALEPAPNAHDIPAAMFVDPEGSSYYVSQETLRPVEFTRQQPKAVPADAVKTPEELRAIAEELALTHSTRFAALRSRLSYTEAGKVDNFFYRWELPGSDVGGMPAILQFGLRADGTVFGYLNSIDLVK